MKSEVSLRYFVNDSLMKFFFVILTYSEPLERYFCDNFGNSKTLNIVVT